MYGITIAADSGSVVTSALQLFSQFAIIGGEWSPFWHDAIDFVGMQDLYYLMYDDPEFVLTLLNRIVDYYVAVSTITFETAGKYIDIFFIGNDFGGQNGPLFRRRSPLHEFRSGYIYLKQGLRLLPLRMDNEKNQQNGQYVNHGDDGNPHGSCFLAVKLHGLVSVGNDGSGRKPVLSAGLPWRRKCAPACGNNRHGR